MSDLSDLEMMEHLNRLPVDRRPAFQMAWQTQRKDPQTALLLSLLWLVGIAGVGRMYAGQVGHGIALLFLGPLTCYIWPLIDCIVVQDAVRRQNMFLLEQLKLTYPR